MTRIASLATLLLLGACAGVGGLEPVVESVTPRVAGVDLDGLDLAFDMRVRNPLPVALSTPRLKYRMDVEGSPLASADDVAGVDFAASGTSSAIVPVRVGYQDLARIVGDLSRRSEASYGIAGAFVVPALGQTFELPFEHAGTFPVVKAPRLGGVKVDTSGIGITGGVVAVDADLTNPNVFGIGLDDLGYALDLGGVRIGALSGSTSGTVGAGETRGVRLTGNVSATDAVRHLLGGGQLGRARLVPLGSFESPWGPVRLRR